MPLYDYKCTLCGKTSEVRHGFNDRYGEPCPACGGTLARVFNPAPIVFKGSGFYVTDSRKSRSAAPATAVPADGDGAAKPDAPKPDAAKPAAKTETPGTTPAAKPSTASDSAA